MAFTHGKNTYWSLAANNISAYTNTSDFEKSADEHDVTTFGQNSHVFQGGLLTGKVTIGGIYDNTLTGPRKIVEPMVGTVVAAVYRPEGTGTGRPQAAFNVHVKSYGESSPVADMVQWKAELTISGDITNTTQ